MVELTQDIKDFLQGLSPTEHQRLLDTELVAGMTFGRLPDGRIAGCIVGVALGCCEENSDLSGFAGDNYHSYWFFPFPAGNYFDFINRPLEKYVFMQFNALAEEDREGTQEAIREYIREVQRQKAEAGSMPEPAMVEKVVA